MPISRFYVIGYRKKKAPTVQFKVFAASLAAVAVLSGLTITSTAGIAQAALVPIEEHWKYNIDWWTWDSDLQKSIGHINPTVVIQNQTADKLEGYIADANGTRLAMYQGEQVVMTSYAFDNGMRTEWRIADKIMDGYFTIEIPQADRNAEKVGIFIGKNQYTVDNGSPTTPQTWVFVNSARLDYPMNLTQTQAQTTQIAQEEKVNSSPDVYHSGSLIDYILSQHQLLLSIG